ncbi:DEAD/DEAH box helicase [Endozoicomonas sp. SCSIO W0465]|uniref:DEAD/DEAH box helicase n=1 Tax=Endozoicomonas sp. SCSIO W0465 TaxID=2918516 RepID=UPI00207637FC|nr:DEAD/DEAH box helicase [Endozoicomonas sp. SCSIO W0465]USE34300.1 DEAD/DEAH box helicase [Endozoicomonas sp. SCSIO W0465]
MTQLIINLNNLFPTTTLQRGRDYFRKNKVSQLELDEDQDMLLGLVRGSGRKTYEVEIFFYDHDDPEEDNLEGFCSCPVGYNCKHTVALLLAGEKKYGAKRLNQMMGTGNTNAASYPAPKASVAEINAIKQLLEEQFGGRLNSDVLETMVEEFLGEFEGASPANAARDQAKKLEEQRNNWLRRLNAVVKERDSEEKKRVEQGKATNIALYVLEENTYHGGVIVQICLSRYLKSGGFGKPSPFGGAYNCLHHGNWPASMADNDRRILKLAYINKRIDVYQGRITLNGEDGHELLEKIMATGRCVVDRELKLPVVRQPAIRGEIRWQLDEQGLQRPSLVAAGDGQPLLLIPSEPACYLHRQQDEYHCGDLTGLPDSTLLGLLLDAPPLDEAGIDITSQTLKTVFRDSSETSGNKKSKSKKKPIIPLPEKVAVLTVIPKPQLLLDSIPTGKKKSDERLARGRVRFDYDGQTIPFGSHQQSLKPTEDSHQIIPRQASAEYHALEQLPDFIEPAHIRHIESVRQISELDVHDLVTGISGSEYRNRWLRFVSNVLPELEEQGWSVTMDDNFPFQFATLTDDDWYAELDESENNWFNLRLGVTVDDKPIDLLPLLARQINQLPTLDELKAMPGDALVPIALPGGKFIQLPAERLRLIAGTLLELFGERPLNEYQLQNYHAQVWQELYDQLGLPWSGGEKLLALSKKLKGFKRLKSVKPPNGLQAELRSYQLHGLSWLQFLREYGLNGILADDMGLGKTLQTLAHIQLEKQRLKDKLPPSLVVCPTSLLHNWHHEASRFTPDLTVHIHHGANRDSEEINRADLVLTSYGVVQRDFQDLAKTRFHLLALDESQAVKNPNAKSAKAVRCLNAEHKLCLTGTPMENHLGELWSLFDFLMPGFLGARDQFTRFYRTPIEKQGSQQQAEKLQKRIAPFMLRRSKDLVAKELPAKTEILRTTALNGKQRDLYETIRASMEARVQKEIEKKGLARSQMVILDALLKMRQACCDPTLVKVEQAADIRESAKLELLMDLVKPMAEEGRKILIFSQFTSMLALIEHRLQQANIPWVKLTGQTRDRKKPVETFQNGDTPVFLISLKAGGTGLNLTAADTVIHYDPWWNPAAEDQASDRAHRIGQDKPVFIYKLITEGTVEEKIQAMKEKKKALADAILSEGAGRRKKATITAEDLNVLFEPLKGV